MSETTSQPRKVALVTGARRGIGAAAAVALARTGMMLAIHHLGADREAAAVVDACRAAGGDAFAIEADLEDAAACRLLASSVLARCERVDVLVNNAAAPSRTDWENTPVDEWEQVLRVNLTAPFLLSQAVLPAMRTAGWGRIVNVTSVTVRLGTHGGPAYIAAKSGLVGLTRTLAAQVGSLGVTVNAVSPGSVRTEEETARHDAAEQRSIDARAVAVQALDRRLVAEDVSGAVAFLASDDAAAITGQVLEVNGGWIMR